MARPPHLKRYYDLKKKRLREPALEGFLKKRRWLLHIISITTGLLGILFHSKLIMGAFVLFVLFLVLSRLYLFVTGSRVFRRFVKPRKLRFTREGRYFVLITIGIGAAAVNTGTNLLYLVLAMMLSMIITSGILSELNFRKFKIKRLLPAAVFSGEPFRIELVAANSRKRGTVYSMELTDVPADDVLLADREEVSLLKLEPGVKSNLSYTAAATRRGLMKMESVEVSSSFPFNFFVKTMKQKLPGRMLVYPEVRTVRETALLPRESRRDIESRLRTIRRGEGDFHGLREYRPGDNPRRIHWRSSARLGEPLVMEHEENRADRAAVILETYRSKGGRKFTEKFENAAIMAASIITHFHKKGYETALFVKEAGKAFIPHGSGRRHYFRQMGMLARIRPGKKDTFAELASAVPSAHLAASLVFAIRVSDEEHSREGLKILRRKSGALVDVSLEAGAFEKVLEEREDEV